MNFLDHGSDRDSIWATANHYIVITICMIFIGIGLFLYEDDPSVVESVLFPAAMLFIGAIIILRNRKKMGLDSKFREYLDKHEEAMRSLNELNGGQPVSIICTETANCPAESPIGKHQQQLGSAVGCKTFALEGYQPLILNPTRPSHDDA